ncbi:MAG: protein kinase [Gemmatimonadota bacterium]|jgi:serine/threonine-protein kinase
MEHEERLRAALADRYRIESEIGSGGMATVYLAQDLKHDRQVALKVLKPELAAVLGGERFLSEIQTTAHLQHPNILPLFDSGEADGQLFYVMPYVEGESLRERLNREKQLPVDEAVRIGTEVAEALQAAHDDGVIHRDIKPANILLRKGKPLVADFGIALAVSAAGGGRLTETGLSLGTPYYMSPEQASADRDPDVRSDVYSLGCVLYETLTGEPPFTGSTAQAVLAKILIGDAARPTERRRSIPANVEGAVLKAIEKFPADRFSSATEFAEALEDPAFRHGVAAAPTMMGGRSWPWKVATVGFAVLAGTLGVWGVLQGPGEDRGVSQQRVVLFDWEALDSASAVSGSVRYGVGLAPDGRAVALRDLATDQILLKEEHNLDPVPVGGTNGGFGPVFSPDGEWIAFFSSHDKSLRKVPRTGGSPVRLADGIAVREQQIAWTEDGRILFTALGWHLDAVSQDGGPVERLVDITGTGRFVTGVTALPGSVGALLSTCDNACPNPEVRVLDFETNEMRPLIPGATGAWYLRSGHLLFVRSEGTVFVAPFDLDGLEISGQEVPVLGTAATTPRRADLAATWGGTVVYLPGSGNPLSGDVEPVWVEFDGTATPVEGGWTGFIRDPALSPNGRYLAFTLGGGADGEIAVKELPDGPITRLTTDTLLNRRPVWALDEESVAFEAWVPTDSGADDLFLVRRADASTPAEVFLDEEWEVLQVALSPDGRWMVYRTGDVNSAAADLFVIDREADSVGRPLLTGDFNEQAVAFSPDGEWVAYLSNESGAEQVVVRPFPDVEAAQHRVSVEPAGTPLWAPDGSAVYFREQNSGWMIEATLAYEPDFRVVERRRLFSMVGFMSGTTHRQFDISPDGSRFLLLRQLTSERWGGEQANERFHVLVRNLVEAIQLR